MFDERTLPLDAERAFARYEAVRPRLPDAQFTAGFETADTLSDLSGLFDVFVLDAYGVLNIGGSAVPGAPETVAALQAAGKRVFVLTNGASFPLSASLARYRSLGYRLEASQVVASREAAAAAMAAFAPSTRWAAAATPHSDLAGLAPTIVRLEHDPSDYDGADAFLFLSSIGWTMAQHERLVDSLRRRPRPLVCANPDLIAPHEDGFSLEPGFFCHHIRDETATEPDFHGKPFPSVFDFVAKRIGPDVPPSRICMVGDTLHTDILGGAAAGWQTVLVTGHGLFKGHDVGDYIARSGIVPDYVVTTT